MKLTKDPILAQLAIEDLAQFEQAEIAVPISAINDFLYQNGDIQFEIALLKEQYPESYVTFHIVNVTYFLVGHVPTVDGIINIPYWDTSKTVLEIAKLNLPT